MQNRRWLLFRCCQHVSWQTSSFALVCMNRNLLKAPLTESGCSVALWTDCIYPLNKHHFKIQMSTLSWGHPGQSDLGQPSRSGLFKQWQSTGAIEAATLGSMNGPDCRRIGPGPALQTVATRRAEADAVSQSPLHHQNRPCVGTVWISYTGVSYVINTNMASPRITAKEGKRILRDFFMAWRAGTDEDEKVTVWCEVADVDPSVAP